MSNNPVAIDFNDLSNYDRNIKKYINDKTASIVANSYTKDEIDEKFSKLNDDKVDELDRRVDDLSREVSSIGQQVDGLQKYVDVNLINLKDHIDENEAEILRLRDSDINTAADIVALKTDVAEIKTKQDLFDYVTEDELNQRLEGLATTSYVDSKISSIDLSTYATVEYVQENVESAVSTQVESTIQEKIDSGMISITYRDF